MAVTMKRITLWRGEFQNVPGVLAGVLEPMAASGADLQIVMGYRYPGDPHTSAIEIYPVAGRKASAAAVAGGLEPSHIPTILVEGENRPGLGAELSRTIAEAGLNIAFLVVQVIGRRYSTILGFESEEDAKKASRIIRKTGGSAKKK